MEFGTHSILAQIIETAIITQLRKTNEANQKLFNFYNSFPFRHVLKWLDKVRWNAVLPDYSVWTNRTFWRMHFMFPIQPIFVEGHKNLIVVLGAHSQCCENMLLNRLSIGSPYVFSQFRLLLFSSVVSFLKCVCLTHFLEISFIFYKTGWKGIESHASWVVSLGI